MKGKTMGAGGLVAAMVGLTTVLCCGANVAVVLMEPTAEDRLEVDRDKELARFVDLVVQVDAAVERGDEKAAKSAHSDADWERVVWPDRLITQELAVLEALGQEVAAMDCYTVADADPVRCDAAMAGVLERLPDDLEGPVAPMVERIRTRASTLRTKLVPRLEQVKADEAERAEVIARCGPEPVPSSWDGTVTPIVAYLQARARVAPDSIRAQCASAVVTPKDCWMLNCRVTSKNAFGVEVVEPAHFYLGAGSSPDSADRVKRMR